MSSGVGLKTKYGRCYPFFQHLEQCYYEQDQLDRNVKDIKNIKYKKCHLIMEDYMECLHKTKEKQRLLQVLTELRNQRKTLQSDASQSHQ